MNDAPVPPTIEAVLDGEVTIMSDDDAIDTPVVPSMTTFLYAFTYVLPANDDSEAVPLCDTMM